MDKEPITLNGLNKLKDELVFLKEKKRPEIVAAIAEARSHGDLKENAEYHAAKEEQSHNEGRITEINDIIARANVIDVTKLNNDGKIIFGSTVFLENLDNGEKIIIFSPLSRFSKNTVEPKIILPSLFNFVTSMTLALAIISFISVILPSL